MSLEKTGFFHQGRQVRRFYLAHENEVSLRSAFCWSLELMSRQVALRAAGRSEIVITTNSPKLTNPLGETKSIGNAVTQRWDWNFRNLSNNLYASLHKIPDRINPLGG